jgi:subtilisin family serine protease
MVKFMQFIQPFKSYSKFKSYPKWSFLWHPILITYLASCGGGGGNSPVTTNNPPYDASVITDLDYTLGTPSTNTDNIASLLSSNDETREYLLDNSSPVYPSPSAAHLALKAGFDYPIAARDTNAIEVWQDGWTGLGQTIGFIDKFDVDSGFDNETGLITVISENDAINSHGERVAFVANSVAPEADFIWYNVIERTGLSFEERFNLVENASIALENAGALIINNSWNVLRRDDTPDSFWESNITALQNLLANQDHIYSDEMLFIYSGGNIFEGGCPFKKIDECDVTAKTIYENRILGIADNRVRMWVGSVDEQNLITSYSMEAGKMANDFLVAPDDILSAGDAEGTSLAAPSVSGAAALLNQKFPNLDGNDIKNILLQTADDLGQEGIDDIYGYGLLDLSNAISPIGSLTE